MRITGGSLRGRVVPGPVPRGVRPTSSRVREALFSVVGQDLTGVTVLDACGGSGLLTFEALSRGADVTTVERNRSVAKSLAAAASALGVSLDLRVGDARNALVSGEWDAVLLDPPYADDPVDWATSAASSVRKVLVVEHASTAVMPDRIGQLEMDRERVYGDTTLSIYWRRP